MTKNFDTEWEENERALKRAFSSLPAVTLPACNEKCDPTEPTLCSFKGGVAKAIISCRACESEWSWTYKGGEVSWQKAEGDGAEFIRTIHGKNMKLTGDDYIPEIMTLEDERELKRQMEERALEIMTPYQRDLAVLGEHFQIHKDLTANEFVVLMQARYPDVEANTLYRDIEQHIDPELRAGPMGDYHMYFKKPKKKRK